MIEDQHILKVIDVLEDLHISFYMGKIFMNIPHPCGGQEIQIKREELKDFLKDRDAAIAKRFGVTKDHYHRWLEFIKDPQCSASTRKGTQCKHWVPCVETDITTPDKYNPDADYFCTIHAEHTEKLRVYNNPYSSAA